MSKSFKTKTFSYIGKIDLSDQLTVSYGKHRSGWKYALKWLKDLHNPDGYLFDSFIEKTFFWNPKGIRPHYRPWIGFIHVPPNIPDWFLGEQSNEKIFNSDAWKRSLPYCEGLFTLSEYHRRDLEEKLSIPICALQLPTSTPHLKWKWDKFESNPEKKIIQVGWWLRKLHSIFRLKSSKYHKMIIKPLHLKFIDDLFNHEREILKQNGLFSEELYHTARTIGYLPDKDYDKLLGENLVFADLYESSANNLIVECIVRNSPVLVNPLPGVVEYLGKDYPLYFNDLEEAVEKAENLDLVYKAHRYLMNHQNKNKLSGSYFLESFMHSSIYKKLEPDLGTKIKRLKSYLDETQSEISQRSKEISNKERYILKLEDEQVQHQLMLKEKEERLADLEGELNQYGKEIKKLENEVLMWMKKYDEKDSQLKKVLKSRSYKIGHACLKPLKVVYKNIKSLKKSKPGKSDKLKVAFIDHSFHKKSKATLFLINLLKKSFDVEIFWDNAWKGGYRVDLENVIKKGFTTILLFQVYEISDREIDLIKNINLVVIPMYDGSAHFNQEFWAKFRSAKFVNFSKSLHFKLIKYGFNSKYFQYFPDPKKYKQYDTDFSELKGYFWQRTNQITWKNIKRIIKGNEFTKIHIHKAIDPPGYPLEIPTKKEIERYDMTFSSWIRSKKNYLETTRDFNVFFAPRLYEGIGMAFIEAMAMGKCVVAPNCPTMNEYIRHGINGLLYDHKKINPLDFSNVEKLAINAKKYINEGYKQWVDSEKAIIQFILSDV